MWFREESRNDDVMYPASQKDSTTDMRGNQEEIVKESRRSTQKASEDNKSRGNGKMGVLHERMNVPIGSKKTSTGAKRIS